MSASRTTSSFAIWPPLLVYLMVVCSQHAFFSAAPAVASCAVAQQSGSTSAGDEPQAQEGSRPVSVRQEGQHVEKAFDIQPLLNGGADPDTLVQVIVDSVLVSSWSEVGGPGTIAIDTGAGQLQVKNFASVQEAVARFLDTLHQALSEKRQRDAQPPLPANKTIDVCVLNPGPRAEQLVRFYVVPSLLFADPSQSDPQLADYDALIRLTTNAIAAESWDNLGGPGSVTPWPEGDALVISQSRAIHQRITTLYACLSRLPGINSGQPLKSPDPIQVPVGTIIFGNVGGDPSNLETWLYPVHDLLPLETRPMFQLSPRAVGMSQLSAWLLEKLDLPDRANTGIEPMRTNGGLLVASDSKTHEQLNEILGGLRRRKQYARTSLQRAKLDAEIFPGLFREPRGTCTIYLYGTCDADRQLAQFATSPPDVVQANLIATDVTDEGLKSLVKFTTLYDLTIWSKQFSLQGLAPLSELPQLQRLAIHGKQISDELADVIKHCPSLRVIDVSYTSITDEGMRRLAKGRQWLTLNVSHTKVTAGGVERLRKTHPGIFIVFEQ